MDLTFGEKIRNARKLLGLTQKQLAEKIGAKHNSVSDWENNKNKPDPDTIELLCGVLQLSPNYLLVSSSDDFSPIEKSLVLKYRSLDSFGQETVNIVLDREAIRVAELKQIESRIIETQGRPAAVIDFNRGSDSSERILQYFHSVSAGTGQVLFDDVYSERIAIPDIPKYRRVAYAVKVSGHSMEPLYSDGDTLLVEPTCDINVGEIGIFNVGGQAYVKKLGDKELISLNADYGNVTLTEDARCMGRVIDKIENQKAGNGIEPYFMLSNDDLNALKQGGIVSKNKKDKIG